MSRSRSGEPGRGLRRWGTVLAVLGVIVMLGSIGGGVALGVVGIGGSVSGVLDGDVINGSGTVTLAAGESRQLYQRDDSPTPSCSVTGPDGNAAADGPFSSSSVSVGSVEWQSFSSFRAGEAGQYTVNCTGGGEVLVAPPLSVGGIFAGVGGILLAVFGGIGGFILLIAGIVMAVVGRSKRNSAAGWPSPPGSPGYGPPGYGPGSGPPGTWKG